MHDADREARQAAEAWFVSHGLPWFVDDLRRQAKAGLARQVALPLALLGLVLAAGAGVCAGLAAGSVSAGLLVGLVTGGVLFAAYALTRLRGAAIVSWALVRTFRSLGLLLPLVTRALPLLLLFITFLFINTEVWQVASSLDGGVLWVAVLLFAAVAVAFLLARLPEELDRVDDSIGGDRLVAACRRTPLDGVAARFAQRDVAEIAQVRGYEKANLVLVLLVSQAVQVLLLSLAVYAFFVVFGAVAIREPVMEAWLGQGEVHWLIPGWEVLSKELLQVATFLAAFSGLYFTVYAVSDETYRGQFFGSLLRHLERAVAVRVVYRSLDS